MLSFNRPAIYVRLGSERITVRNIRTGASLSETPWAAVMRQPKFKFMGAGSEALSFADRLGVEVLNPFGHPRSLASDFTAGEQVMKVFLARVHRRRMLVIAPTVVLHLLGNPDGGYTQIEIAALREMTLGAGASQVILWQGRDLTDEELRSGRFPADGRVLT